MSESLCSSEMTPEASERSMASSGEACPEEDEGAESTRAWPVRLTVTSKASEPPSPAKETGRGRGRCEVWCCVARLG